MRVVRGSVVMPEDAPQTRARFVTIEVRDVSYLDAPSVVVAQARAEDVAVEPGVMIPFELVVPEAEPGRTLAIRAHVSFEGSETVVRGDALSTTSMQISPAGDVDSLEVRVRIV